MERKIKTIKYTKRAEKDFFELEQFNIELYGIIKSEEITDKIIDKISILENSNADLTKIGTIDSNFRHLKGTYRKLIVKHCKITYRVGKSNIYIVRVFDTRQNPIKNK